MGAALSSLPTSPVLLASAGNTRLALAAWDGTRVCWQLRLAHGAALPALPAAPSFRAVVCASVRPASTEILEQLAVTHGIPRVMLEQHDLALEVATLHPQRVGIDRLLVARAALMLERRDWVVVDAGTAITVDAVTATGRFLGGAIAPGLAVAAQALVERTALLPPVKPSMATRAIGNDTEAAMAAGLYWGFRGLVAELARQVALELATPSRCVITGGDGALLAAALPAAIHEPDLLFLGMLGAWGDRGGV